MSTRSRGPSSCALARLLLVLAAAALAACSGEAAPAPSARASGSAPGAPSSTTSGTSESGAGRMGSGAASARASSASAPSQGPLSAERIVTAGGTVKVGDAWAATEARLVRELGPASRELLGMGLVWGVSGQDDCTHLVVRYSGALVSEVVAPGTRARAARSDFEECFSMLDRSPPDRDADGAGPTDGKVYSVRELRDGLDAARSKWAGRVVRVRGKALSVVRSGPDAEHYTNASIRLADERDEGVSVGAQVRKNVEKAPRDGQKVVITVVGKVDARAGGLDDAEVVK
jgi:hypothetical protein